MCSIIGLAARDIPDYRLLGVDYNLNYIFQASLQRGRDGFGFRTQSGPLLRDVRDTRRNTEWSKTSFFPAPARHVTLIANMRAEPTTEFVKDKRDYDQQPYTLPPWSIVHNGTVANDKELRTNLLQTSIDSAAIVEVLAQYNNPEASLFEDANSFAEAVSKLKGSYAILATHERHPGYVFASCNYRPIWFARDGKETYFASARDFFPAHMVPQMVDPYSTWLFSGNAARFISSSRGGNDRALVICSGGMDSTVAARQMQADGYEVGLIHFQYGSRAEGPEVAAVKAIAERLEVPLTLFPLPIYDPKDSPLLRADSTIAGGEAGAEFAHEWVPARNLVMLAVATAYAEANDYSIIVLGNNLEEAGAYPDNEPEFIERMNDALPFAVGDGKSVQIHMPVGNLMKHEIVAIGIGNGAPLDLTWSCYRAGAVHCGTCGPCYMRRKAFEINGLTEVIPYANERA